MSDPSPSDPTSPRAVVTVAVASLNSAPRADAPLATQAILGESVAILETSAPSAAGFARVQTEDGYRAWISPRDLRTYAAGEGGYASDPSHEVAEVIAIRAHVYAEPAFSRAAPPMTVSMGTRLESLDTVDGLDGGSGFERVRLPDRSIAFLASGDCRRVAPNEPRPLGSPAQWLGLGKRLAGAPYTWGGTTPFGFDCSGLVQFVFRQHGVLLKRDAHEQCFQEPRLVAIPLSDLREGDLVFFGEARADGSERIDHVAMWANGTVERNGLVLEATRAGQPSTRLSSFDNERLKSRARHARRLRDAAD